MLTVNLVSSFLVKLQLDRGTKIVYRVLGAQLAEIIKHSVTADLAASSPIFLDLAASPGSLRAGQSCVAVPYSLAPSSLIL